MKNNLSSGPIHFSSIIRETDVYLNVDVLLKHLNYLSVLTRRTSDVMEALEPNGVLDLFSAS